MAPTESNTGVKQDEHTELPKTRGNPKSQANGANGAGVAINALSRVLAVLLLGAGLAGLGVLLDSWLGTNYWTLIGIIAGTILAIPGLMLVANVSELDAKRSVDPQDSTEAP